jgi:small subunit ribosomal protein S5
MKGNLGRKRGLSVMVITGNGNGMAGFALTKAVDTKAALRKAKNRAGQKLMHIDLYNKHTVYHDFFCQFGKTKIYVQKKSEGYGLSCHRAIKTICEVAGINDLCAKIEGSNCVQHIVKATLRLLKQLHLVEYRKEHGNFPKVIASPIQCRKTEEIKTDEVLDFIQNERVVLKKKKHPQFFMKLLSWEIYLRKQEKMRNHDIVRRRMLAEHGEIRSFLTDKYSECSLPLRPVDGVKVAESEVEQQIWNFV